MKFIPLDAVLAEIKKRKKQNEEWKNSCKGIDSLAVSMVIQEDINILSFIDTLEVKEMDLEKELIKWHKEHFKKNGTFIGMSGFYLTNSSQMDIAKHFFELGVNASNPLTWEDIENIITISYKLDKEEEISGKYAKLMTHYQEVLKRFKAQKGE